MADAVASIRESGRKHVWEAIRLNVARGRGYAAITAGESRPLTRRLVLLELLCLVPLAWFDWRARKFQRRGIPIIAADFTSMTRVNPADAPIRFQGIASEGVWRKLAAELREFRAAADRAVVGAGFREVARLTSARLHSVEQREEELQCLFPMTRHLLESVGIFACHAVEYAAQSGGDTVALSKSFLRFHLRGVGLGIDLDRRAQACHALGAGIIENDVPAIPFETAWAELSGA